MKKNFIYQSIYQVLIVLIPFITTPFVSRILGPEGIGTYSYTYSIVSYFVMFAKMGIGVYGNREVASVRNDKTLLSKTFWNIYAVHILFSLLSIGLYLGVVINTSDNQLIVLIQGIYILSQLLDINWFYFGIEKFRLTVIRNTIIKFVTLICIFVFIKSNQDTWKYVLILAGGSLLGESAVWIFNKNYIYFVKPTWIEMKKHVKPMVYLFLPSVAISIYTMMDKVLINYFSGTVQVGYYENAEKIVCVGRTLVVAMGTVSLPYFTDLISNAQIKKAEIMSKKSVQFMMWISSALVFGLSGVADVFVPLYLGEEFQISVHIVEGLVICIPFWAIADIIRNQYILPMHKDNVYVTAFLLAAVINLIFNIIFIPQYKAMGAVVGTVAAEATVCIVLIIAAKKMISPWYYFNTSVGFVFLGAVMYLIIRKIGVHKETGMMTLVIQIVVGAGVYLIGTMPYYWNFLKKLIIKIKK